VKLKAFNEKFIFILVGSEQVLKLLEESCFKTSDHCGSPYNDKVLGQVTPNPNTKEFL